MSSFTDIVHKESNAILVVDNTPLSSYFQRPLTLGADAVAYSLTKFMNGHNDGMRVCNKKKVIDFN